MPLDVRRTLRPLGGEFLADGWWKAARTPEGPATVHIQRDHSGVRARAWGPGSAWALDRAPDWIGLGDAPEALITEHEPVRSLARRNPGLRFGATALVFEALVRTVVAQKVAGKEASRSVDGLHRRFSGPAPGPSPLPLPPDPHQMAEAPYWEFHAIGLERRRADILRALSRFHERLEGLAGFSSAEAQATLCLHRGIGVWTAAETVAVSHGDADAVSVGDYHHKNLVAWHLEGRPRGTDEEMLESLEPFRPHRGRVVRLLGLAGRPPTFGPRMPIRSIADR